MMPFFDDFPKQEVFPIGMGTEKSRVSGGEAEKGRRLVELFPVFQGLTSVSNVLPGGLASKCFTTFQEIECLGCHICSIKMQSKNLESSLFV